LETTSKFTGKAETYKKFRPDYPVDYINYIISYNNLEQDSVIADIGSGTGKLTKQLLDRSHKVIAVEPNDDMRSTAEKQLGGYKNFISVNGTAENTGIAGESIDLITVAQAFHWFDVQKFKMECIRILRPNKNVALVWNSRNFESQLVIDNAEVCKRICPLFTGFSGGKDEDSLELNSFFKGGKYDFKVFRYDLTYDLDGFLGRNLSASYAPKETDETYREFVKELTELFERYSKSGKIIVPNLTKSYIGKVV
jgi:SAM-dependent methyltransferase